MVLFFLSVFFPRRQQRDSRPCYCKAIARNEETLIRFLARTLCPQVYIVHAENRATAHTVVSCAQAYLAPHSAGPAFHACTYTPRCPFLSIQPGCNLAPVRPGTGSSRLTCSIIFTSDTGLTPLSIAFRRVHPVKHLMPANPCRHARSSHICASGIRK